MANNDDLIKQIGEVVDQKIVSRLKPFEERLSSLEKEQQKQGKELKKIKHTLDVVIDHFDRSTVSNTQRIKRIEEHLHI